MTSNVRGIVSEGLNLFCNGIHDSIENIETFSYSRTIKKIAAEIFGMKAPLIGASSYIMSMSDKWSAPRKDNSFVRTTPASTQVYYC